MIDQERCKRCGSCNAVWSAQSPLWNAVIRGGSIDGEAKYDDMVCATCFMQLAEEQGVASLFRVTASQVNVDLETTTPSGRVWDERRSLWVEGADDDQVKYFVPVNDEEKRHHTSTYGFVARMVPEKAPGEGGWLHRHDYKKLEAECDQLKEELTFASAMVQRKAVKQRDRELRARLLGGLDAVELALSGIGHVAEVLDRLLQEDFDAGA